MTLVLPNAVDYSVPARQRAVRQLTKQLLIYGGAGGVLIALLKFIEYKHFILEYPGEVYRSIRRPHLYP